MGAGVRKLGLTAHVLSSLAWFGSVAAFLALAIAGLTSANAQLVRAAYISMNVVTAFAIVPFCFASLITGIVQSLGTPWGLVRHYWVLLKLIVTVLSTAILLPHARLIRYAADMALDAGFRGTDLGRVRVQLVADAGAALLALLFATVLAVYKPRGVTPFGQRRQLPSG
jgi:hypothetical protein